MTFVQGRGLNSESSWLYCLLLSTLYIIFDTCILWQCNPSPKLHKQDNIACYNYNYFLCFIIDMQWVCRDIFLKSSRSWRSDLSIIQMIQTNRLVRILGVIPGHLAGHHKRWLLDYSMSILSLLVTSGWHGLIPFLLDFRTQLDRERNAMSISMWKTGHTTKTRLELGYM